MIKPEQIPPEVVDVLHASLADDAGALVPKSDCLAAIAAGLAAWPGVKLENLCGWVMDGPDLPYVEEAASLILPLPQEVRDE